MFKQKYNIENVIISRGEIIEIGGSYRLPEIILESDLNLLEVEQPIKQKLKTMKMHYQNIQNLFC